MYQIIFYENSRGENNLLTYLRILEQKKETNKNAKIKFNKIVAYLDLLSEKGPNLTMPVARHLTTNLWELRPLDNRIIYAYYKDNTFVILHSFTKKTKKTPKKELKKALKNYNTFIEDKKKENEKLESSKK